jgi:hypothetical protein
MTQKQSRVIDTHANTLPGAQGQVPGLALPPSAELMDRLRTGQGITVAVIHLDTIIADTHGICGHDSWIQGERRAYEPNS